MWGNRKKKVAQIDSLIGHNTRIKGEINFIGGLHVDGYIEGNIIATNDAIFTLSEQGTIEGNVRVPNIILNGTVKGNVYAEEHVELAPNAYVTGSVYYNLIEMTTGAKVDGNLIHRAEMPDQPEFSLEHNK